MKNLRVSLACLFLLCGIGCGPKEDTPVGGECSSRDDCQNRNDCMGMGEKSYCTTTCMPTISTSCPLGTTCKALDVEIHNGSQELNAAGIPYCVPDSIK